MPTFDRDARAAARQRPAILGLPALPPVRLLDLVTHDVTDPSANLVRAHCDSVYVTLSMKSIPVGLAALPQLFTTNESVLAPCFSGASGAIIVEERASFRP